jgi:2-oxoglutarate dehydrogenase E2 component (dihydrolipoamide succinyltransferase)
MRNSPLAFRLQHSAFNIPHSSMPRTDLVLPDLELDRPVKVSQWLVARGDAVCQGDAVLELVAGAVTVDIPAPTSGVLIARLVRTDDPVEAGQRLGVIEEPEFGPSSPFGRGPG